MPIYTVRHNGKTYEIRGPEGATAEQLQAHLESTQAAPQASAPGATPQGAPGVSEALAAASQAASQAQATHPTKPDEYYRAGDHGAFTAGASDAAIKAAIGLDQLNALSPVRALIRTLRGKAPMQGDLENAQGVLGAMKEESANDPEKGLRTTGEIAANIGMTAIPVSALSKTLGGTSKVAQLGNAMATSGITGMAINPGQGEDLQAQLQDKAVQSAKDAAAGGVIQQGGRVLSKVFRGAKLKPDAQKLFDQGVNPTMQQGAANPVTRFVGGLASGATNVKERQAREVLDAVTSRAAGGKASLAGGTLDERVQILEDLLSKEYDTALKGKKFPISPTTRGDVAKVGSDVMTRTGQFADESAQASKAISNVMGDSPNNLNVGIDLLMKNYMNPLAMQAGLEKSPRVREALLQAREVLMEKSRNARLTPYELKFVHQIDSKWYDLSRLRDVAKGAAQEGEGVPVRALTAAYANAPKSKSGNTTMEDLVGPAQRILGTTPTQDQARAGMQNLKRVLPLAAAGAATGGATVPAAMAAAPVYALSAIGQSAPGARAIFGQTEKQKLIAELLRKLAPYGAATGAAIPGE